MKATVKTVTGEEITFTQKEIVESLIEYFGPSTNRPLGWIGENGIAVNFAHVVYVRFDTTE